MEKEESKENVEEKAAEKAAEKSDEKAAGKPEEKPAKEAKEEKAEEKEAEEKVAEAEEQKAEEKPEEKAEKTEKKPEKSSTRKIVRVGAKDLDGMLTVKKALPGVQGVGFMFANAVSTVCGFGDKRLGELSEHELKNLGDIIENPAKYGIPAWLYNRRFDPVDGKDTHLISARLELKRKMDINELKKRKCYRGVRHIIGLPVRGQRTRSSFRRSATVGVSRVKARPSKTSK